MIVKKGDLLSFDPIPYSWSRPVDPGFHFDYEFGENRINRKDIANYPTPTDYENALAFGTVASSASVVTEQTSQITAPEMTTKTEEKKGNWETEELIGKNHLTVI